MVPKPNTVAEAHAEIYRLVDLLHRQQQDLARTKRMVALLKRVPADLAEREGDKAAGEEAARQQRELPQLLEEMLRRAEVRPRQEIVDRSSVES